MDISTNYNTSIVAVARSISYECIQARLAVYDLETKYQTPEFAVRYDFGGQRLALSRDDQCCFVGCYNVHGLAAYSAMDGSELWRRKDLKAVQSVDSFPFDDFVFCGREGVGHLLCTKTGQTIEKLRGVKAVYCSPFGRLVLISARSLEVHSPLGTRIGKITRTTFAELDCCFSDSEILVTESGGAVRCFDLASLELLWTYTLQEKGGHFLRLSFNQALGCFVGIHWHYKDSTAPAMRIVHFERRTGLVIREVPLGTTSRHTFCLAGSIIFTAELRLVSVETGKVIHEFRQHSNNDDHTA